VGEDTYVLSNQVPAGDGVGLFSAGAGVPIVVSATITDAFAFAFAQVTVVRDGQPVGVQVYLGLTPNQIHLWKRDEAAPIAPPAEVTPPIDLGAGADGVPLKPWNWRTHLR
jgi:hypothetical protein